MIEKLTEADIPKETATELLEFVEKKQTNLVTKDHLEARMAATDAKIEKLDTKIIGLMLFLGFNTTLLVALIILIPEMSFG